MRVRVKGREETVEKGRLDRTDESSEKERDREGEKMMKQTRSCAVRGPYFCCLRIVKSEKTNRIYI